MKSSAICQLAGFMLFLPFLLLPAEPILSTEYAEEAAGEAVTFRLEAAEPKGEQAAHQTEA